MFLVGLFFSFVSVRIDGPFSGGDLALASRVIMAEVSGLRGAAVHTRKDRILRLYMGDNTLYSFVLLQQGGDQAAEEDQGRKKRKGLPRMVSLVDVVTSSDGKVQEGEAEIRFHANGRVERSMIHLKNDGGEYRTLEINPLTGVITIHDGYIDQKAA